ncbi:MAG: TlpA disulfide reductase family protein [Polaribacter sp.]|jgi:thiol-disulfide isomerase/thioredoxin|nr:TlpA disulfide reductase family protein [Polaribacter sp.]
MLKKISIVFALIFMSCNLETPLEFSEKALHENLESIEGVSSSFEGIINKYKGKKILVDVWASWCRDCIEGIPKVKELQKEFPGVVYLFLSVDEKVDSWKRSVKHYDIIGEHYNMSKGMKNGDLVDFLDLSWIPRYLVLDEKGKISVFNAIDASDQKIKEALNI